MAKTTSLNKQNKLIQVLQKLSATQLTKLLKFIQSPYFHQTVGVTSLFVYLRKFHPRYPLNKVSNEAIAQQLFPKAKNGAKKVKNFKTDLMKLVEQFLILQQFSQQNNQQQLLLAQAYQDLELPDLANSSIRKIKQSLEKSSTPGLAHLHQKLQLSHFQYYHSDKPKTFNHKEKLQDLLNQLDHYFVTAKYKYTHEALERISRKDEDFKLPFWKVVQSEAPNFGRSNIQSSTYYYHQLQQLATQSSFDEACFESLKNTFFKNLKHLDEEDQQAIYKYLLNYLTSSLNSGDPQLAHLQFDLYKNGLSNHLGIWKNRISEIYFYNIVAVTTACKAFDWVEDFINTYQKYLKPDLREDMTNTAKAIVAFRKGNAMQVLSILSSTPFKNNDLEVICFPLEVKSLFEVYLENHSYHSTVLSRLESLSKKISTKYSFSIQKKTSFKNYVHYVQSLLKYSNDFKNNTSELNELLQQITSTKQVIHKSWLIEKCHQIINQKS